MRLLEFKTTQTESGQDFKYQDNLIFLLKNHSRGMDIAEMEKALRIIATIKNAKEKVMLEDADHQYIVQRLDGTLWTVAEPAALQLVKDVKDAPKVDANELLAKV